MPESATPELPTEPILRLEPGMHWARIWRIDVDAEERFLVTGSHDKTVRVWALDDGRPLKTLRVPIGEGNVGEVYAVAISPDGVRIAAGGWGPGHYEGEHAIYVFDRASARLIQLVDGLPGIFHLGFSPNGQRLVAALSGANGIRVYEGKGLREVAADPDYGDRSHWATFDNQGWLVTSSFDGKIRLYDPDFRLTQSKEAPGGSQPFGVAFAPDGRCVAVGYGNSTRVDVLDGRTLAPLFAADTTDSAKVAWSVDSRYLYATGQGQMRGKRFVRAWGEAG
jgi:DNA-binding beta-propeller fold protein YncE